MGDQTFEAAYYASVVDDLRIANERLNETIANVRHRTNTAETLIKDYLRCLEDGRPVEDVVIRMHQFIR